MFSKARVMHLSNFLTFMQHPHASQEHSQRSQCPANTQHTFSPLYPALPHPGYIQHPVPASLEPLAYRLLELVKHLPPLHVELLRRRPSGTLPRQSNSASVGMRTQRLLWALTGQPRIIRHKCGFSGVLQAVQSLQDLYANYGRKRETSHTGILLGQS